MVVATVLIEMPLLARRSLGEMEWAAVWGVLCVGLVVVAVVVLLTLDPYHE